MVLPALSPLEHQGRKLPDKIDGTFQPAFKLQEKSEFSKREYRVQASLEQFDLEDLISDLPRPDENAPSYAKWRKHSKMVRTWFISAIHNDLLDDIMDCGERLEYADEFLQKIRKIMISGGHRMAHTVYLDAIMMKRKDFGTIAFRQRVDRANKAKMTITPYSATSIMLYNIEKELPAYVSAKWLTFSEDAATELTIQDFKRICGEVKDQALVYKDSIIAAAPKTSSSTNVPFTSAKNISKDTNNLSNRNRKDYPTRRNAPPEGADHDEYVKKWKEYL